jgi:1,2-diacylglycerol 3-alpha-glucosyltransferase
MKIILATETYLPTISGVVVFTQNLAEELVKRGHEVAIFAPSGHRTFHHEVKNGIHVYRFPSFPVPFRVRSRFTVRQYRKVEEMFAAFKPDVVHLQSPSGVPAAVLRCARRSFVPIIATHHFSLEFILAYLKPLALINSLTHRALVSYLNRFYRRCDYITCPTETIRKNLTTAGLKVPLHVVSNGVSLTRFTMAAHTDTNEPTILYVGRIDQDKNIPVLLHMIPPVIQGSTAKFVIAGGGNRLSYARSWVKLHGLTDRVTFLGKISHQSPLLRTLFQEAAVFVVPSMIETQSLGTLEALATGVPVVASDAGALPELVHDGENGYLIPPEEPNLFTERILQLLHNPDLRKKMGKAGRQTASQHDIGRVIDRFIHIYEGNRD